MTKSVIYYWLLKLAWLIFYITPVRINLTGVIRNIIWGQNVWVPSLRIRYLLSLGVQRRRKGAACNKLQLLYRLLCSPFDHAGPLTETILMGNLALRSYMVKDANGKFPGRKKLLRHQTANWKPAYYLALIESFKNDKKVAKELMEGVSENVDFAPLIRKWKTVFAYLLLL